MWRKKLIHEWEPHGVSDKFSLEIYGLNIKEAHNAFRKLYVRTFEEASSNCVFKKEISPAQLEDIQSMNLEHEKFTWTYKAIVFGTRFRKVFQKIISEETKKKLSLIESHE